MNCKLIGEQIELRFLLLGTELGYALSKPWGDSRPYDFVVEGAGPEPSSPHKLSRVHVRGVSTSEYGRYNFPLRRGTRGGVTVRFAPNDIEFFALCVEPHELWYFVPVEAVLDKKTLWVFPGGFSEYNKYLEAWCLLGQPLESPSERLTPRPFRIPQIYAVADESCGR